MELWGRSELRLGMGSHKIIDTSSVNFSSQENGEKEV
jgi:hypothetical protein